jgi:hypothetical protein
MNSPDFPVTFKNITRLNIFINDIIPANFVTQNLKESRLFEYVNQLTSRADFIKAVKAGDIAEA